MPSISYIRPTDQPLGTNRLLAILKDGLQSEHYVEFGFAVAFVKAGPLLRLQSDLDNWLSAGKEVHAIAGIDQTGTSVQALNFLLKKCTSINLTSYPRHSFHPKIYWFRGDTHGKVIIGSNNLTVGGTELNFEASVIIDFNLPQESEDFDDAKSTFDSLLPGKCGGSFTLTQEILNELNQQGLLLDEEKKGEASKSYFQSSSGNLKTVIKKFTQPMDVLPQSGISTQSELGTEPSQTSPTNTAVSGPSKPLVPVTGFAIQIRVHHNGEIFLSKNAASQNPAFFGLPFTGRTTPKKEGRQSYPERQPDPVCNIYVYGKEEHPIKTIEKYDLNTVLYESKSEIRVTIGPLVGTVPEYSILVMTSHPDTGIDYQLDFITPESPQYGYWNHVCNQKMPGGGKTPRRFGWF